MYGPRNVKSHQGQLADLLAVRERQRYNVRSDSGVAQGRHSPPTLSCVRTVPPWLLSALSHYLYHNGLDCRLLYDYHHFHHRALCASGGNLE